MAKFKPGEKARMLVGRTNFYVGDIVEVVMDDSNGSFTVCKKLQSMNHYAYATVTEHEIEPLTAKPTMTAMQVANGEADAGVAWLPPGASVVFTTPSLNDSHDKFFAQAYDGTWVTEEDRKKRKAEGRCETCGELRPMDIWGLGDCPVNSEHTTPAVKQ